MKAKPVKNTGNGDIPCEPHEATAVWLRMPGPLMYRRIPVIIKGSRRDHEGPVWSWNGDTEKPTLKPSILTRGSDNVPQCHTWVTDGRAQFLSDCTHELAGQTLDLLEVDI